MDKKINRSDISRATGTDLAHISRIFNRKALPGLTLARKIAQHLGVTLDELCDHLEIAVADLNHSDGDRNSTEATLSTKE